jgi:putative endopeptidase
MGSTKKFKPHKNKTIKHKVGFKELQKLCRKSANTFNRFEDEYEEKGNVDIDVENQLIKFFSEPFAPKNITPKSDFYTYINYKWIQQQKELSKTVKKYYVQTDSFRIVQEKVYKELIEIIHKYIKEHSGEKRAFELKNCFNSFDKPNDKYLDKHLADYIDKYSKCVGENNLMEWLVFINRNEVISWGAPLVFSLAPDMKNASIYRCYINQPELTFYDYEIYIDDPNDEATTKTYKQKFRSGFKDYVKKLFARCMGPNYKINPQEIIDCEVDMMVAMGCNSVKNESEEYYNVVQASESFHKYGFDWKEFATRLGFNVPPKFFIASNLSYLKCIMKLMNENWKTEKWRNYFIFLAIRQMSRFSYKDYTEIYFPFFGDFVEGQDVPYPRDLYAIFGTSLCFNTLLCNEYIDANKKQEHMDYVGNIAYDLRKVFKRIMGRNTWLSPQTKKYALMKLNHLKFIIGSPKILREDPLLTYSDDDPWGNIIKITNWRTKKLIPLEGEGIIDIPLIDWKQFKLIGKQSYVVNAYYTPIENSIYVPLAYLQKPFIDLDERGIEYNLAHIGYTLGHEMGHSVDDMGSRYDYKGNLNNWWTAHDKRVFNRKVSDVVKQYESFALQDGIKMDATLSTGENLADIAGLAICSEYLRDFQDHNGDIAAIREISFKAFYIYIAVANRQNIFKKAVKSQLKINPHPMNKYRTNCPLTRLKLFRSMFNIKKGDKMYWHNTDTIW